MNKIIIIILIAVTLIIGAVAMNGADERDATDTQESAAISEEEANVRAFAQCLADEDLVAYISRTCPACQSFASQFGGYKVIEPFMVDCGSDPENCRANMQTEFVPELQIDSIVYNGDTSLAGLSVATGCRLEDI